MTFKAPSIILTAPSTLESTRNRTVLGVIFLQLFDPETSIMLRHHPHKVPHQLGPRGQISAIQYIVPSKRVSETMRIDAPRHTRLPWRSTPRN
jgi:hypothetical protein